MEKVRDVGAECLKVAEEVEQQRDVEPDADAPETLRHHRPRPTLHCEEKQEGLTDLWQINLETCMAYVMLIKPLLHRASQQPTHSSVPCRRGYAPGLTATVAGFSCRAGSTGRKADAAGAEASSSSSSVRPLLEASLEMRLSVAAPL